MSERMKPMGMDRALSSKMGAKYDPSAEAEVRHWIKELLSEDIGEGSMAVEKNLKDGVLLLKLLHKLYENTSNLPPKCSKMKLKINNQETPFKQMENIELFLKGANAYGVPYNSLFQTVDLFEGRNMAMVIATILQVGTESQRNGFNGPVAGTKPIEKHIVKFTEEQLKAGQGIIGLQAGTNKLASQKGMKFGASRHIADIRADDMVREGQCVIGLQAGTNKMASQRGMCIGAVRHIADIRADDILPDSHGIIGLQAGSNKGASQSGMSFGSVRHIADIRADDALQEGQGVIGLQSGSNKFASQKGMSFGASRHIADIRADDYTQESHGIIGAQMGTNQFASQKGMSFGSVRHVADIRTDDPSLAGHSIIGYQSGSNLGASQSGMSFGAVRQVSSTPVGGYSQFNKTITPFYGSSQNINQYGGIAFSKSHGALHGVQSYGQAFQGTSF